MFYRGEVNLHLDRVGQSVWMANQGVRPAWDLCETCTHWDEVDWTLNQWDSMSAWIANQGKREPFNQVSNITVFYLDEVDLYHDWIRQYVCLYCEPGLETYVSSECRRLHLNRLGQCVSLYYELGNKGKGCVFYQGAVDCTLTEWDSVSELWTKVRGITRVRV